MINLIQKLFIRDYKHTTNPKVRLRYGVVAGVFGIVTNILLFVSKLIIGLMASSITIIADAVNNLSDTGSSVITVFGFKMSAKPADPEHPYGHARYEYITSLVIAIVIIFIGGLLAKDSIEKIINPVQIKADIITIAVLVSAIFVKLWQMFLYKKFSMSIDSDALRAAAVDSRNDIVATFAVLVAIGLIILKPDIGYRIDGIMGLAVSIFIIVSSIGLIKSAITPLLGEKPDDELIIQITEKILEYDGVLGLHDLMIHSYGKHNIFAIVHVEVSSEANFLDSHDLVDAIERDFQNELDINLSIHIDPIELNNPLADKYKECVEDAVKQIDSRLSIHSFRKITGKKHTNILFDVTVPYGLDIDADDIEKACHKCACYNKKVHYIIRIDIDYNNNINA